MLAPDPQNTIDHTTAVVNSNAMISVWVQALSSATLPELTPPPDWYTNINGVLTTEQAKLKSYWTTTGPATFATATQSLVNYGNAFGAQASTVTDLVGKIKAGGGIPSKAQQDTLSQLVKRLLDRASTEQAAVSAALSSLTGTYGDLIATQSALATAVRTAQQAQAADYATIQQIRQQISAIQQKIAADTTKMDNQQVSAGTGMASVVGGLTFGLAAAGGVLTLGAFAIAVLSAGAAATFAEIYSQDVQNDFKQLQALVSQLSAANVQLALVQGVLGTLQQLAENNASALQTFNDFTDTWDLTVLRLNDMMVVLDQPQIDVRLIPDLNNIDQAAAAWQRILDFATQAQKVPFQTGTLSLPTIVSTPPNLRVA
jgi:hypothetical protein